MRPKALLGAAVVCAAGLAFMAPVVANTLYDAGRGMYGGRALQDSSGTYWDQNTHYGNGMYWGGSFSDNQGNTIECDRSGYCTSY